MSASISPSSKGTHSDTGDFLPALENHDSPSLSHDRWSQLGIGDEHKTPIKPLKVLVWFYGS